MTGHASTWAHGPLFEDGGVRFRLWAPAQERVSLVLEDEGSTAAMEKRAKFLEAEGLARRRGQGIVFARDLLATLRKGELDNAIEGLLNLIKQLL